MNINNAMRVAKIDASCACLVVSLSVHANVRRREWKRAQREAARQDAAEVAEEEEMEEEQPSTSQQADESEFCL